MHRTQARPVERPMTSLRLVNPELGYPKASLIPPTSRGYLYVAASVHPGSIPVVLASEERSAILSFLKAAAQQLRSVEDVVAVDVFRSIVMPPTSRFSGYLKERGSSVRLANFDVSMLIQTSSIAALSRLQARERYSSVIEMLR